MNTKQVAQQWVQMCREGKSLECINELYADTIVSKEMPGMPGEIISGKQNVLNKGKEWLDNVAEFHSNEIEDEVKIRTDYLLKYNVKEVLNSLKHNKLK